MAAAFWQNARGRMKEKTTPLAGRAQPLVYARCRFGFLRLTKNEVLHLAPYRQLFRILSQSSRVLCEPLFKTQSMFDASAPLGHHELL
jgi:hypothetical protein